MNDICDRDRPERLPAPRRDRVLKGVEEDGLMAVRSKTAEWVCRKRWTVWNNTNAKSARCRGMRLCVDQIWEETRRGPTKTTGLIKGGSAKVCGSRPG